MLGKVKTALAITLAMTTLLATAPMTTAFASTVTPDTQIGNPIPPDPGTGGTTTPDAPVITSNSDISSQNWAAYQRPFIIGGDMMMYTTKLAHNTWKER